ncbi:MAG: SEC-C metal-binding domain-containing protein [Acidimicrobiales bacterium]
MADDTAGNPDGEIGDETFERVRDAVMSWLEVGPRDAGDLAEQLVDSGLYTPTGDHDADVDGAWDLVDEIVTTSDDTWVRDDDMVVSITARLAEGVVFTHRLSAEEIASGEVVESPNLAVLEWNAYDELRLRGGGRLRTGPAESTDPDRPWGPTVVWGPPGWLDGFEPGDLIAFDRVDIDVDVYPVEALGDGAAEVDALREYATGWVGDGRGSEETPIVMEAIAHDELLFSQPVPPVGELLEAAGLERRGHEWGWADELWSTVQERRDLNEAYTMSSYGFDTCCTRALERVRAAFEELQFREGEGGDVDLAAVARDLGHGDVARAFVNLQRGYAPAIVEFADTIAAAGGRNSANAHALAGLAHRWTGNALDAEAAFGRALGKDPACAVAAGELAELAADRGDISRAHALAVRDDDDEARVDWLAGERDRRAGLRPRAGRNEPCPCGSGRKFKQCCGRGGAPSLLDRMPFVQGRIVRFATHPDHEVGVFTLAVTAVGASGDVALDGLDRFRDDGFVIDVAVHEGGLALAYLAERGDLLPDDERRLVVSILDEPRRLWEITEVRPGEALVLRDTATGETVDVAERSGTEGREAGELVMLRVVHVGDDSVMAGVPIIVPLGERERVLALLEATPDAATFAEWYGSLYRLPTLTNREGHDMVLCRTELETDEEPGAVALAFDALFTRDGEETTWHESVDVGGETVIGGTIRLDGTSLVVESNSEERQDRLVSMFEEILDAWVVDDERQPAMEAVARRRADGAAEGTGDASGADGAPSGLIAPEDAPPEIREALLAYIEDHERRWVDEPIPALGGSTPREALDDPTRREDLFALLRDMRRRERAQGAGGVAMSADRIEALLGIDVGS